MKSETWKLQDLNMLPVIAEYEVVFYTCFLVVFYAYACV